MTTRRWPGGLPAGGGAMRERERMGQEARGARGGTTFQKAVEPQDKGSEAHQGRRGRSHRAVGGQGTQLGGDRQ